MTTSTQHDGEPNAEQDVRYMPPRLPERVSTVPPVELTLRQLNLEESVTLVEMEPHIDPGTMWSKWFDPDNGWQFERGTPPSVDWVVLRDKDGGASVPSTITSVDLLQGSAGHGSTEFCYYFSPWDGPAQTIAYPPVARTLGATPDVIKEARGWAEQYTAQREASNRADEERFWSEFASSPAFDCLPVGVRNEIMLGKEGGFPQSFMLIYTIEKIEEIIENAYGLLERQDKGEIVTNFGGWSRDSGDNTAMHWVISPDGTLRECDDRKGSRSEGGGGRGRGASTYWNVVEQGEVAVSWAHDNQSSPVKVHVAMGDPGTITPAQLKTLRAVEDEQGVRRGSFGLDKDAEMIDAPLRDAIIRAASKLPMYIQDSLGEEIDLTNVVTRNGVHVYGGDDFPYEFTRPYDLSSVLVYADEQNLDPSATSDVVYQREAERVYSERVHGGLVELFAYLKWGQWNLNLRWRPIEGWDVEAVEEVSERAPEGGEVPSLTLEALRRHFNG